MHYRVLQRERVPHEDLFVLFDVFESDDENHRVLHAVADTHLEIKKASVCLFDIISTRVAVASTANQRMLFVPRDYIIVIPHQLTLQ